MSECVPPCSAVPTWEPGRAGHTCSQWRRSVLRRCRAELPVGSPEHPTVRDVCVRVSCPLRPRAGGAREAWVTGSHRIMEREAGQAHSLFSHKKCSEEGMMPWPPGQLPASALGSVPPWFCQQCLTCALQTPSRLPPGSMLSSVHCPPGPLSCSADPPSRPSQTPSHPPQTPTRPPAPGSMLSSVQPPLTAPPRGCSTGYNLGRPSIPSVSLPGCLLTLWGGAEFRSLLQCVLTAAVPSSVPWVRGPPGAASGSSGAERRLGPRPCVCSSRGSDPQPHRQPYPRHRGCWVGAEALEPEGGLG